MKTVYKYALALGFNKVTMPVDSQILTVQMQDDCIQLWALVDLAQSIELPRQFIVFGTGQRLAHDPVGNYIATVQSRGLVWHVFETSVGVS